jgi:hypothetical protein
MMTTKSKKIAWPGMTADDRCGCEICRGREALPPEEFKPKRYWHEVETKPPESVEAPAEVSIPAPAPRPARARRAAPTGTLEERIAAIQARTDIGQGLKTMQIKNLVRKETPI